MGKFAIEAMVLVHASPERIFEEIQDLRRFNHWNAFMDNSMHITYSDNPVGVGAVSEWDGPKNAGRMTIIDCDWPSHVNARMEFLKPAPSTATVQLRLFGTDHGTEVWWVMSGVRPAAQTLVTKLLRLDTMLRNHFQQSLDNLKAVVER